MAPTEMKKPQQDMVIMGVMVIAGWLLFLWRSHNLGSAGLNYTFSLVRLFSSKEIMGGETIILNLRRYSENLKKSSKSLIKYIYIRGIYASSIEN